MFQDIENYDHTIPFLLISVEYWISSIPISWQNFPIITMFNYCYIAFQGWWLLQTGETIYELINWKFHPVLSFVLMHALFILSILTHFVIIKIDDFKFRVFKLDMKMFEAKENEKYYNEYIT